MVILDNSIVFTGLPQIQSAMGFSATGLSWITNAYVLVFGGLLLLGARADDLFGHRRMFVYSLIVFSLASLLVGAAQTQWWLIAARALQGVGAAVLAPSALSLLTRSFAEGRARDRAMAAYSAVAGLGASLGLVLGGLVADLISWRAGFFLNVPVGLVMIVLAVRHLSETERRRGGFDIAGALLATLGSTALVLGIVDAADFGWGRPGDGGPAGGRSGAAGPVRRGGAAGRAADRAAAAVRRPGRSGAYLARMLYMGAMIGFFFTAQYVQSVYHWTPLQAGLAFLPMTLVDFVVAVQVPRLLERARRPLVLLAGVTLTATGIVWLSSLGLHTPYVTGVALPMILFGVGQGPALAPMTSSGVDGVAPEDADAAAGLALTMPELKSCGGDVPPVVTERRGCHEAREWSAARFGRRVSARSVPRAGAARRSLVRSRGAWCCPRPFRSSVLRARPGVPRVRCAGHGDGSRVSRSGSRCCSSLLRGEYFQ